MVVVVLRHVIHGSVDQQIQDHGDQEREPEGVEQQRKGGQLAHQHHATWMSRQPAASTMKERTAAIGFSESPGIQEEPLSIVGQRK